MEKINKLKKTIEKEMNQIDSLYEKVNKEATKSYELKHEKLTKEENDLKEKLQNEVTKVKEKLEKFFTDVDNIIKNCEKINKGIKALEKEEKNMIKTLLYVSTINKNEKINICINEKYKNIFYRRTK